MKSFTRAVSKQAAAFDFNECLFFDSVWDPILFGFAAKEDEQCRERSGTESVVQSVGDTPREVDAAGIIAV